MHNLFKQSFKCQPTSLIRTSHGSWFITGPSLDDDDDEEEDDEEDDDEELMM
jgi:hypothetical protein